MQTVTVPRGTYLPPIHRPPGSLMTVPDPDAPEQEIHVVWDGEDLVISGETEVLLESGPVRATFNGRGGFSLKETR